jgi:hypothetical protein
MVHTEPPRIVTPFVPGIYLCEDYRCGGCRSAFAEVLVVFPGMKTARWALLAPGCSYEGPRTTLNMGNPTCERLFERVYNHPF